MTSRGQVASNPELESLIRHKQAIALAETNRDVEDLGQTAPRLRAGMLGRGEGDNVENGMSSPVSIANEL